MSTGKKDSNDFKKAELSLFGVSLLSVTFGVWCVAEYSQKNLLFCQECQLLKVKVVSIRLTTGKTDYLKLYFTTRE